MRKSLAWGRVNRVKAGKTEKSDAHADAAVTCTGQHFKQGTYSLCGCDCDESNERKRQNMVTLSVPVQTTPQILDARRGGRSRGLRRGGAGGVGEDWDEFRPKSPLVLRAKSKKIDTP
jgi:hypothetical protein